MRPPRRLPLLVAALALIAACSGGSEAEPTATSPATDPATTAVPSTAAATDPTEPATTVAETTTTVAPDPVYPLTGLPIPEGNPLAALRPAIVAKVGNYDSHPQYGMNQADIVYEEIINDSVSRFAMVFQSQGADLVGPMRSGRLQDVDLLGSLNAPILAWSGGNRTVTNEIDASDLVNMSPNFCGSACFRVSFDKAPYNLFFNINAAWEQSPPGVRLAAAAVPVPRGHRPRAGHAVGGRRREDGQLSRRVDLERHHRAVRARSRTVAPTTAPTATWPPPTTSSCWHMVYNAGISGSPDAESVGTGEAWVFTGGNLVHGTWTRADRLDTFTLTADDGSPILLTPGRTFIELPRSIFGNVAPRELVGGAAAQRVPPPSTSMR